VVEARQVEVGEEAEEGMKVVVPPRSGGERSEPERRGGTTTPAGGHPEASRPSVPDPEVPSKAVRRRFTAAYKRRILQEIDACGPGGTAAVLRREGLYSSHLITWKRQRQSGEVAGLEPRKRGRKAIVRNPLTGENEKLRRDNERLQKRLRQAETIIGVQKKLCELLGLPTYNPTESSDSDE
jgi:transposase-like protein